MNGADKCIKCGSCVRNCPVVSQESESVFPGPRSLAIDAARLGAMPQGTMNDLLACSMCHRCELACPVGIDLPHIMLALRARERSSSPLLPGHARLVDNIDRFGTSVEPSGQKILDRSKADAKVMYFPGCIAQLREPMIASSTIETLEMLGSPVTVPNGLVCCGSPLEKIGDEGRRERLLDVNIPLLKGGPILVASCPGCTSQLIERYDLDAMHVVEYLFEEVGTSKIAHLARPKAVKVAVHHPCHLSRQVGPHTKDYTIEILKALPGVSIVETGDEEVCCGAGGGLLSGRPEIAGRMAATKIWNATNAGAEIMISACPFCVMNLERSGDLKVVDILEFVRSFLPRC